MVRKLFFAISFSILSLPHLLTASFTDNTTVLVYPHVPTNATKLNPALLDTFNAESFRVYGYATGKFESVDVWGNENKFGISVQIKSEKSHQKICFSNEEIIPAASSIFFLHNSDFGSLSLDFATNICGLKSIIDIKNSLQKMFGLDTENNAQPIKIISPSYGYGNGLYHGSISFVSLEPSGEYALFHSASSGKFTLVDENYAIWKVDVKDGVQLCLFRNGIILALTKDFKDVLPKGWVKFKIERHSGTKLDLHNPGLIV